MTKPKKKIKVHKVTPHVKPKVHEVVLHVESEEPPPEFNDTGLEAPPEIVVPPWPREAVSGVGAIAERTPAPEAEVRGKRSFWNWLFGD